MDTNVIIQVINGVGFPIFACIAMGYYIYWDRKQRLAEKKERQLSDSEMYAKIMLTVENNTKAIDELRRRLEGGYRDNADE